MRGIGPDDQPRREQPDVVKLADRVAKLADEVRRRGDSIAYHERQVSSGKVQRAEALEKLAAARAELADELDQLGELEGVS